MNIYSEKRKINKTHREVDNLLDIHEDRIIWDIFESPEFDKSNRISVFLSIKSNRDDEHKRLHNINNMEWRLKINDNFEEIPFHRNHREMCLLILFCCFVCVLCLHDIDVTFEL